jgi:hypothetical protein
MEMYVPGVKPWIFQSIALSLYQLSYLDFLSNQLKIREKGTVTTIFSRIVVHIIVRHVAAILYTVEVYQML